MFGGALIGGACERAEQARDARDHRRHLERAGPDRIPEFYTPDFVGDYRPYGLREGHAGVRAMVEGAWRAFPDYHEEVHELIAEGDRVVLHLTISGTQLGQWGPLPPTGKRAEFDEIIILRIRDGKVVGQRGVVDNLSALRQLGVVPTPPS